MNKLNMIFNGYTFEFSFYFKYSINVFVRNSIFLGSIVYLFSISGLPKIHKLIFLVIDMSLFDKRQTMALVSFDLALSPTISLFKGKYLYKKSSAFFTARTFESYKQHKSALITTLYMWGQKRNIFSLLFLVTVDSSLTSFILSYVFGCYKSGSL